MSQLSAKITADVSGYRKSIQDAKNVLKAFTKEESVTAETLKKVYDVTNEQVNAYKKVTDSMLKATDGTKTIKQASNQLKNDIEKLKIQWANLSETARNSKFGQSMTNSIRTAEAQLKSMQTTMTATQAVTTSASSSLSSIVSIVGKFAPAIAVGTTALNMLKDVFFASESNIDEWGRTVEGAKGAYNVFLDSLNGGDWSNFFSNVGKANKEMRRLYDTTDLLGSMRQNNAARMQYAQSEVDRLRGELAYKPGDKGLQSQLANASANLSKMQTDMYNQTYKAGLESIMASLGQGDDFLRKMWAQRLIDDGQQAMEEAQKRLNELSADTGNKVKKSVGKDSMGFDIYAEVNQKLYETSAALSQEYDVLSHLISKESSDLRQQGQAYINEAYSLRSTIYQSRRKLAGALNKGANGEDGYIKELEKERAEAKKLTDDIDKILSAANKNRSVSLSTYAAPGKVDITSAKNYVSNRNFDAKKMQDLKDSVNFEQWTGNLGTLNSSLSSVYDTMQNIGSLDNPFKVFDALINTATNVKNVVDTMQNLGTMMRTIGAINKTETANAIAMDQAKIASNQAETASSVGAASAETMAAHASIPFVGIAIATAAIGAMMAVLSSTKSKVPKFANGGIISGPTLGLMGEYSGASNNPEVVAPLDKLRSLIGDNGNSNRNVRFEIEGRTLVGILGKENRLNSRR